MVTDSYEYDAYGNSFTVSGTTPNEMMYRGEQYDPDLGLYYLRARYYNPNTGRFMSRDPYEPKLMDADGNPVDPRALHKYLYADGDPINLHDPSGRASILETGAIDYDILLEAPRAVAAYGRFVADVICGTAKLLSRTFTGVVTGAPSPYGIPGWSLNVIAALCTAFGLG